MSVLDVSFKTVSKSLISSIRLYSLLEKYTTNVRCLTFSLKQCLSTIKSTISLSLLDLIKLPVNVELNYRESADLDFYYSFAANKYPGFALTKTLYVFESQVSSL